MGIDTVEFVYPERISGELMCAICTLVLERPVVTEYEVLTSHTSYTLCVYIYILYIQYLCTHAYINVYTFQIIF